MIKNNYYYFHLYKLNLTKNFDNIDTDDWSLMIVVEPKIKEILKFIATLK